MCIRDRDHGEYTIKTGDVEIVKPFIKEADGSKSIIEPSEARLRNLNYSAHMYLDMALVKGDSAVSYTHLDVYKRQLLYRYLSLNQLELMKVFDLNCMFYDLYLVILHLHHLQLL